MVICPHTFHEPRDDRRRSIEPAFCDVLERQVFWLNELSESDFKAIMDSLPHPDSFTFDHEVDSYARAGLQPPKGPGPETRV